MLKLSLFIKQLLFVCELQAMTKVIIHSEDTSGTFCQLGLRGRKMFTLIYINLV